MLRVAAFAIVASAMAMAMAMQDQLPDRDKRAGAAEQPDAANERAATTQAPAEDAAPPDATLVPNEISVLTLLREMVDLDHLTRLPRPAFTAAQAASTDRRSRRPDDYAGWFANDDFVTETAANLVRVEEAPDHQKRYVLLDAQGPGALVRIWSATPTGILRIYIDGKGQPALEAPMADLLSGRQAPFVAPLGHIAARGANLYFPFPFRDRCVVTVDTIVSPDPFTGQPKALFFYQLGYRRYEATARADVRSYSASEVKRARHALAGAARGLSDGLPDERRLEARVTAVLPKTDVAPGRSATMVLRAPKGGGEITEIRLRSEERRPEKLRSTSLSIRIDGEQTVDTPLIDFFGTGPAWSAFTSLPFTVSDDGALVSRFRMPFRRVAEIALSRASEGTMTVEGDVTYRSRAFDDGTLLFHARWHPRETIATRPYSDWRLATIEGTGHYVGTLFNVENPPGVAWWGEGDEKIYVDGDLFPSIFGTGAEDYFGYAWSTTETFAHGYHAQTRAGVSGFAGPFSMNRFHILDPIPFGRSLRFDFEIWHWSDTRITTDAVAYWYARPTRGQSR